MNIQVKTHAILLYSLLGLAILWGPTASAHSIDGIADFVFGQPNIHPGAQNFTSNTINAGATPGDASAIGLDNSRGVAIDAAGNVYVTDQNNHRVLIYLDPIDFATRKNTDTVADVVLGQPDFIENNCNAGAFGCAPSGASTLAGPSVGVAVDAAGNVYVADTSNNRVLVYLDPLNSDAVADLVLGQPDFTSNAQKHRWCKRQQPKWTSRCSGGCRW